MPTTGTVLSKYMKLYIGATAISCQVDASLNITANTFEVTCKDSGANSEFLPGSKSWSISGSANFAFDATVGFDQLFDSIQGQTLLTLVFQTGVTGDKKYTGSGYLTSLSAQASGNDEAVTYDFELQGTGALVRAVIA